MTVAGPPPHPMHEVTVMVEVVSLVTSYVLRVNQYGISVLNMAPLSGQL